MGSLRPGIEIDLRGVIIPSWLLDAVLDAVTGPDGRPHLGRTRFDGAVLPTDAGLRGFCVEGDSSFDGACFLGAASFYDARFFGNASFRGVRFGGNVSFHGARFHRHTSFEETVFLGDALFGEAGWYADASFRRAAFLGAACFDRAGFGRDAAMQAVSFGDGVSFRRVRVTRHARFDRTRFRHGMWLGPLVAGGRIGMVDATVHGGLSVHAAARQVSVRGATVHGAAEFRLRHAELDLEDAVVEGTASVRSLAHPILGLTEPPWTGPATVRLTSLRRTDAALVRLTDVDLSGCGLLGLRRPDALRFAGDCPFATVPGRSWLRRGAGRAVLADDLARDDGVPCDRLQALYFDLARAAAASGRSRLARDFRFRALDMRRRSEPGLWRRWYLHLLFISCGFGVRAGRVVAWLVVVVTLACWDASFLRDDDNRPDKAQSAHVSGPDR